MRAPSWYRSRGRRAALAALVGVMVAGGVVPAGAVDIGDPVETVIGDPPLAAPPDGEGLPADATTLYDVGGIAVHPWTGEIYWSDTDKHRIRRLTRDGRSWTVAGDGTAGFGGDGGDAAEAELNRPRGIAFDGDGRLYIADSGNHRIRMIDTLGFISTVAGGGDPAGGGLGDGAVATDAELSFPSDVDVSEDGSYFVVADSGHHRVRRINVGGVIFTTAGTSNGFSGDEGPATAARLSFPEAVLISEAENILYISDLGNLRLRSVTEDGTIFTVAGDGTTTTVEGAFGPDTGIGAIRDIAIGRDRRLFITDHNSDTVRVIAQTGQLNTLSGQGTGAIGTAARESYNDPTALAFDRAGRLLVSDDSAIVRITPAVAPAPTARANPYGRPAEDQVRRLYRAAFGRTPDAGGLLYWVRRYQGGDSMLTLAANFLASAESAAIYGEDPTDLEFLTIVYANVLGRGPDSGGLAFWLDQLAGGRSRASVLEAFADSPENIEKSGTAPPMTSNEMAILRLYRAAFGRVPDAGGLDFWVARLNGGESLGSIAMQFIASPEGSGYLDTSEDTLFVEALYGNVLGRNADAAGLDFWVSRLDDGWLRAEVLLEFSESPENRGRTGTA